MKNKWIFLSIFAIIFCAIPIAQAEILVIEGSNEEEGIYISIDGDRNTIILDTIDDPILDSKMKIYNTGGFNLKNSERNVSVWVHPFSDTQYRIVVKSSDGVHNIQRIIGTTVVSHHTVELVEKLDFTEIIRTTTERAELKSSVGKDVEKYDIPVISRDDGKDSYILSFRTTEMIDRIHLDSDFDFVGYLYEVRTAKKVTYADVTFEISRDDYVIRTQHYQTSSSGYVEVEFRDLDYPEFYPTFCYDVTMTMVSGNTTYIWDDDFRMTYPVYVTGEWEADMEWLQDEDWDYLPKEFRNDPPEYLRSDSLCNR